MPQVSVVIPTYNAGPYIQRTIYSILNQSFPDFEILIIDDGSTDDSLIKAKSFSDQRIHVFENRVNRGPAYTQNVGLNNANGEYIAIIGADDEALPERLEKQVRFLQDHSDIGMVGTSFLTINEDSEVTGVVHLPINPLAVRWRLRTGYPIGAPTVMLRRDIIEKVGGFNESLHYGEDLELWARIAKDHSIGQIDLPLTKYRKHSSSITSSTSEEIRNNLSKGVHERNWALLTGKVIQNDVADALFGFNQFTTLDVIEESYQETWRCIELYTSFTQTNPQKKVLFHELLRDLLLLARQNEYARHKALETALRYGLKYYPWGITTPTFLGFTLRVVLPRYLRKKLSFGSSIS